MRLSLPRLKMPRLPGFGILVCLFTALKGWVMASRDKDSDSLIMYDRTLFWLTLGLAAIVLPGNDHLTPADVVLAAAQYSHAHRLNHHAVDRSGCRELR